MSKEKKVITITGEEIFISKCRKFNKIWYKIGDIKIQNSGDCYLINDIYYRFETNNIVYNYSINEYILKTNSLVNGVVGYFEDEFEFGYFNNNKKYATITTICNNIYYVFDTKILENSIIYKERLMDGNFYHISKLTAKKFNSLLKPSSNYKQSLPYDSKDIIESNLKKYNENYNPEISDIVKNSSLILKNLSFGLEFETVAGFIPERILNQYGLIPLRDGSISGIEYVTVPLEGEKGLQCVVDMSESLKKRTIYNDNSCSLHLHLGNIPRTKEFILAFTKLTMFLQDEIFSMFPLYKKYNMHFKNKNYSEALPTYKLLSELDPVINKQNIDKNFNVIYKHLSMGLNFGHVENNLDNVLAHPADLNGNQKWNIKTRYHIHNLIPLIFGNKKTIEFRIHTPTYEANKIIPFILMNSILINFTIDYQKSILENPSFLTIFSLYEIIKSNLYEIKNLKNKDVFANYFLEYIEVRKGNIENQIKSGNIIGTEDKIGFSKKINWNSKVKTSDYKTQDSWFSHFEELVYSNNLKGVTKKVSYESKVTQTIKESMEQLHNYDYSELQIKGLPEGNHIGSYDANMAVNVPKSIQSITGISNSPTMLEESVSLNLGNLKSSTSASIKNEYISPYDFNINHKYPSYQLSTLKKENDDMLT